MSLWVPPEVSRELMEERLQREAVALHGLQGQRDIKFQEEFNRDLENIWPGMRLVWCTDPAPVEAIVMGAKPGRWGILLPSQTGGPGSVKPLVGRDGESYVEPGSWVFDMLKAMDEWNPDVRRERKRVTEELERAKKKRIKQEEEEFDAETYEIWRSRNSVNVSFSGNGWTNSTRGRRSRRK